MRKQLFIPRQVVECLAYFDAADRGQAFSAIFSYIDSGEEPSDSISSAARGAFEFARRIIDPILERRRKAAERRAARKAEKEQADTIVRKESEKNSNLQGKTIANEHLNTMSKVVKLAYRLCSTHAKRDEKIRSEMQRRYPGMYSDVIYDKDGVIDLVRAA